jgi:hypothetical protein
MKKKQFGFVLLAVAGLACLSLAVRCAVFLFGGASITVVAEPSPGLAENVRPHPAGSVRLAESYGKLPLSFEVNQGQVANEVKFLSRGGGYTLFLTGNEAVLSLRKPGQKANGKRQMANVALGSYFNPAAPRVAPRLLFNAVGLPRGLLPTSEQLRDSFARRDEAGIPNPESRTPAVLRMSLAGSNPHAKVSGLEELPGKSNYFIGNDPKKWRTNVPTYGKVKYEGVYRGVDLVYYGNQGRLEYDFVVAPGADPSSIQLTIIPDEQVGSRQKAVGSETEAQDREPESQSAINNRESSIPAPLRIDRNGDLVVQADGGEVRFHKPVVYQTESTVDSRRSRVDHQSTPKRTTDYGQRTTDAKYVLKGDNQVTFEVASYDRSRPLVIDPVLVYSTYLGGSDLDHGSAIAVDASGNAYVTGSTSSTDFLTTSGAFKASLRGSMNAFVTKLNAAGSALVYSTYLGTHPETGLSEQGEFA